MKLQDVVDAFSSRHAATANAMQPSFCVVSLDCCTTASDAKLAVAHASGPILVLACKPGQSAFGNFPNSSLSAFTRLLVKKVAKGCSKDIRHLFLQLASEFSLVQDHWPEVVLNVTTEFEQAPKKDPRLQVCKSACQASHSMLPMLCIFLSSPLFSIISIISFSSSYLLTLLKKS